MRNRYLHNSESRGIITGVCAVLMALSGLAYGQSDLSSRIIQRAQRSEREAPRDISVSREAPERAIQSLIRNSGRPQSFESPRSLQTESRTVLSDRILTSVRDQALPRPEIALDRTREIEPIKISDQVIEREKLLNQHHQEMGEISKRFEKEIAKSIDNHLDKGERFEVKDNDAVKKDRELVASRSERDDSSVKERRVQELARVAHNITPTEGTSSVAFVKEKNATENKLSREDKRDKGRKSETTIVVAEKNDKKDNDNKEKDDDKKEDKKDKKGKD